MVAVGIGALVGFASGRLTPGETPELVFGPANSLAVAVGEEASGVAEGEERRAAPPTGGSEGSLTWLLDEGAGAAEAAVEPVEIGLASRVGGSLRDVKK